MSDRLRYLVWEKDEMNLPRDEAAEVFFSRCRHGHMENAKTAAERVVRSLNDEGGYDDRPVDMVVGGPNGDVWDVRVSVETVVQYTAEYGPKRRPKNDGGTS